MLIFGAYSLFGAGMETGTFIAFTTAFTQGLAAMLGLGMAATTLAQAVPLYESARPILEAVPEQTSRVFPGSILQNIVGTSALTLDDAWKAAVLAGLDEDIRSMPMGMQTFIVEGGSTLSGGQRQRLLIARAIVQRPRILLFDEATSALDNQTQEIVSRALDALRATRLVIAHA